MTREQNEAVHWLNLASEAERKLEKLSEDYLAAPPEQTERIRLMFQVEAVKIKNYRAEAQKWIDKVVQHLVGT